VTQGTSTNDNQLHVSWNIDLNPLPKEVQYNINSVLTIDGPSTFFPIKYNSSIEQISWWIFAHSPTDRLDLTMVTAKIQNNKNEHGWLLPEDPLGGLGAKPAPGDDRRTTEELGAERKRLLIEALKRNYLMSHSDALKYIDFDNRSSDGPNRDKII